MQLNTTKKFVNEHKLYRPISNAHSPDGCQSCVHGQQHDFNIRGLQAVILRDSTTSRA